MRTVAWGLVTLAACQPSAPSEPAGASGGTTSPRATVEVTPTEPSAEALEPAAPKTEPQRLADDEPLREGRVEFVGLVRPTKGGLDVRGVTLSLEKLHERLPPKDRDDYDELLGAKLRVVADLEARGGTATPPAGGEPAIQSRGGTWFVARNLRSAAILAPAVVIEGEVTRSKGLLAVGGHLVTRDDLAWSLKGSDPMGKRVRLWGQPRTYVCPPHAQCLVGGSIPMFDVARAKLLQ